MRALLPMLFLLTVLSGCLGSDPAPPPQDEPIAEAEPTVEPFAGVVFDGRLTATGVGEEAEAWFEVPEGATRLTLRSDDPSDLAVGRYQLWLEPPRGEALLVYGGYGYRSPINEVFVGSTGYGLEEKATAGSWHLWAVTDGHVDLGVVVEVV